MACYDVGMQQGAATRIRYLIGQGRTRADIVRLLQAEYGISRVSGWRWHKVIARAVACETASPAAMAAPVAPPPPALVIEPPPSAPDDRHATDPPTAEPLERAAAAIAGAVAEDIAAAAVLAAPHDYDPDDDLAELVRVRDVLVVAMRSWEVVLAVTPTASLTYQRLARTLTDVTARIVELRPRPDVDAEHLRALGADARTELLVRATAGASADEVTRLRAQVAAMMVVIGRGATADADEEGDA